MATKSVQAIIKQSELRAFVDPDLAKQFRIEDKLVSFGYSIDQNRSNPSNVAIIFKSDLPDFTDEIYSDCNFIVLLNEDEFEQANARGLGRDLEKDKRRIVFFNAGEPDYSLLDFIISKTWSVHYERVAQSFSEIIGQIKRKIHKDIKISREKELSLETTSLKAFAGEQQKIFRRILAFFKDEFDISKKMDEMVLHYLQGHHDVELVYEGNLLRKHQIKIPEKQLFPFVIWLDGRPTLQLYRIKDNANFPQLVALEVCFFIELVYELKNELSPPWQVIINSLPFPMLIMSNDGEIFVHNKEFSKLSLGPTEIPRLLKEDIILLESTAIKIFRERIIHDGNQLQLIIIHGSEHLSLKGSSQQKPDTAKDLGIIASSLAHELNNPIAGILTALEVLIEEQKAKPTHGVQDELLEMKKCAEKCRDLVKIFLGFSKFNIDHQEEVDPMACLGQSLNLLHFRMVESGINLDVKIKDQRDGEGSFKLRNNSLFTMILYLCLNAILSFKSHRDLVEKNSRSNHRQLILNFNLKNDSASLELPENFSKDILLKNKLLVHLLDLMSLKLNFGLQEIKILSVQVQ